MNSNEIILHNGIYVDADTTFYKDTSVTCFNLRWEKGEGFIIIFFLNKTAFSDGLSNQIFI